jgi:transketolase
VKTLWEELISIDQSKVLKRATRDGFGKALYDLGKRNPKVVALCADLTDSLKMTDFKNAFPDRFFECGVAEANMMGVAAGLATAGFLPYVGTFANFGTGRVYDQIRQSIAYSEKPVKICCSHAGLTLGEDGATHQILEDIALMRVLPNMVVVVPADANQTYQATLDIAELDQPVYLRFGRPSWPVFLPEKDPTFQIGKIQLLKEGSDLTIVACGHLVWEALLATMELEKEHQVSVELINLHTIKPLDTEGLLRSIQKTGCLLTVEEHQVAGGMGSAVIEALAEITPVPYYRIGVRDSFGESGKPHELLQKYGLSKEFIKKAALEVLKRK